MRYDKLSKDELVSKIAKLERDLVKANSIINKIEKTEDLRNQQSSILKFINSMAIPSADKSTVDELTKALLKAVKDYTRADLATFSLYLPNKKELFLLHIEADQDALKRVIKIAGKKIVKISSPVDDKTYRLITKKLVATCKTFTEVTFGAIPKVIDKAIRATTDIDRLYPVAHVIEGKLYGTTLLGFKKTQTSPSIELLKSYAHLMSVSLRRYNAEKALQNSEIKYRTYIEHAPLGIFIANDKGKYIDVNPGAAELLGYTQDELLNLSIPDLLANRKDIDSFQKLKDNGKLNNEINLKKKDGTVINVRLDAVLLPNKKFIAFHTDITNHKKFEKELIAAKERAEESKANITAIIEGTSDSIWAFNNSYELLYINNTFRQEFLKSFDILLKPGMNLLKAIPKSLQPFWKPRYDRVLNNEQYTIEDVVSTKNGTLYIEVVFNPIIKNGQVIGGSCFGSNITSRKLAEIELQKAKEKAEESDRLKSAFLANMSHEIRTPMNGILGFAELLKEPRLTGDQQENYINIIKKSGDRMLNIINDIIDISKIESGQMKFVTKDSNINKQLEYIYTFFKPETETKGIQFVIKNNLPPTEAIVRTDREKLFAILTNLVKNAIKFTDQGSIELGCKPNGEFIEFFVKDSGVGIPKNRQTAIFERFIQADIEDSKAFQGAGLGLSITKSYVEMLGGKIWVESEEGKGSTFYFTIPHNIKHSEKTNVQNIALTDLEKEQIRGLKILIVDDDENSKLLISKLVNSYCKEPIYANNGLEAIEACKNNPDLDLILMDIKMPKVNGYEATKQIRKFNKEVVIISQTAFGLSKDREKALESGCNDYISKPIKKDLILNLLEKYFS